MRLKTVLYKAIGLKADNIYKDFSHCDESASFGRANLLICNSKIILFREKNQQQQHQVAKDHLQRWNKKNLCRISMSLWAIVRLLKSSCFSFSINSEWKVYEIDSTPHLCIFFCFWGFFWRLPRFHPRLLIFTWYVLCFIAEMCYM